MANIKKVGDGKVVLIAGGGKTYSDVAAKFCRSEKEVDEIIASSQSKQLIKSLINSGHKAALEFDEFIFGVEGYSRVTEVQLVRKRHASYMISSGRVEKGGDRAFNVVIPEDITKVQLEERIAINPEKLSLKFMNANSLAEIKLNDCFPLMKRQFGQSTDPIVFYDYDYMDILNLIENWYNNGIRKGVPEEDLRYMKPQATEFKAAIKMNATALRDWARIRMCFRAQKEIRDLCCKMVDLAIKAAPELMEGIGPACRCDGYCSEMEQCSQMKGVVPTKKQVLSYVDIHKQEVLNYSDNTKYQRYNPKASSTTY